MSTSQHKPTPFELTQARSEFRQYVNRKPNKVPPANSPTRPWLESLWLAACHAIQRNPQQRTFTLWGVRFGVVYVGGRLGVLDIRDRHILVSSSPPRSDYRTDSNRQS